MSPEATISTLRFMLRAANTFLVDLLTKGRQSSDLRDTLILAALTQCNSAPITGDPDLQRRYALMDTVPPADLLRPISVSALAASLDLPFETVRRRIKRMVANGICEVSPEGVRLTDAILTSPLQRRGLEMIYGLTRSFYFRLRRAGCVEIMGLPEAAAPWSAEAPPVRIVFRAANDYLLRMMEHLLPRFTSLAQAFIVLAVVRANTAELPDTLRGSDGLDPEAFVPDSYRKPARVRDVATQLGLPAETVRRNLVALAEDGRCQRLREGFIVPATVLARPNVLAAWDANLRDLTRMFTDLADAGVIAFWDAELARDQSAA